MSKEDKKDKKSCTSKKGSMLAFGLITLSTRVISAVSLVAISLSFCSIKKEAQVFNDCVEEVRASGQRVSSAVSLCNGGN